MKLILTPEQYKDLDKPYNIPTWLRIRKFFGTTIVALQDFDGEVTYRPAKRNPYGFSCDRIGFGIRPIQLNKDGTILPDCCYVKRWKKV